MKKVISVLLSVLMSTSIISGLNLTAFAAGNTKSTATQIALGQTVNGSIKNSDDEYWYKFTTPSSGRVTVSLTYSISAVGFYWGRDGSSSDLKNTTLSKSDKLEYDADSYSVDCVGDTFYVCIERYWGDYGNYSLNVSFASANESFPESYNNRNDSKLYANTIGFGQQYNGHIAYDNDVDYYKFTLPCSAKVDLSITNYIDDCEVVMSDDNGNNIIEKNCGKQNSKVNKDIKNYSTYLSAGTYYIKFSEYYSEYGNYSFALNYTSSPESFPESYSKNDDTLATANKISLNKTYYGQFAFNDIDYYKFKLTSKKSVTVTVNASSILEYKILDKNGNYVKSLYTNGGKTEKDIVDLSKGTYYFAVYSGDYQNYKFKLSIPTKPAKAKLNKLKASKGGKIKATWAKTKGASGYQLSYSKSKSFKKVIATKTVNGSKKTSYTGKNFTKGKKYYVRVRAYKKVNGKKVYGSWSNVKSVKAK